MISILLNSRAESRENKGGVVEFLNSAFASTNDPKNIEIIFKFDCDDRIAVNQFLDYHQKNPELQIKCVVTQRYYYKGLHLGYSECFKIINNKSKIITCMADDFIFCKKNWELELLEKISSLNRNELYTVQNFIGDSAECVPICPMWSPKIIEICEGFGPIFATDGWSLKINQLLKSINPKNIIMHDICVNRLICHLDGPNNARWGTDRAGALSFLNSNEFHDIAENYNEKLKNYHNNLYL